MSAFPIHALPERTAGAAENMATDFMLLQRYPFSGDIRFRAYGWTRPAFTFGYSQKFEFIQSQLPAGETVEVCRRATGGGLVDHRNDWTYALVIPRGHPVEDLRATESYRLVHAALRDALVTGGQPAALQEPRPTPKESGFPAGVCFSQAEPFDVINPATGAKIAGAAQKRNKRGLLLQGSLARAAAPELKDWDAFGKRFVSELLRTLSAELTDERWPDWSDEELSALTEQYGSAEWNQFR